MYSRIPRPSRWNGNEVRREPSYRRNSTLPPNYSGTVFSINPSTGEMTVPDAAISEALPRRPEDDTTPRFDDLPRVSNLPVARRPVGEDIPDASISDEGSPSPPARGGLLSLLDSRHFPFGHGIGYEEMFLLGLIFFLSKECDGEGDFKETLLLLGLLLLGG